MDYDDRYDDDYLDYAREAYEEELISTALQDMSVDRVKSYLGSYGDAIERRVRLCIEQAEELFSSGFSGSAITLAATASEIVIRFLLLRPLLEGAFLSDEWAEVLSKRVVTGRSSEDRNLLPAVLRHWGTDITEVQLSDGSRLWEAVVSTVWPKRNGFVHQGTPVTETAARTGIECAKALLQLAHDVGERLGFTLKTTAKWCEIRGSNERSSWYQSFDEKDPFT